MELNWAELSLVERRLLMHRMWYTRDVQLYLNWTLALSALIIVVPYVVVVVVIAIVAAGQMIYMRQVRLLQVLHEAGACRSNTLGYRVQLSWLLSHSIPYHTTPFLYSQLSSVQFICICIGHVLERVIFLLIFQQICTNMNLSGDPMQLPR